MKTKFFFMLAAMGLLAGCSKDAEPVAPESGKHLIVTIGLPDGLKTHMASSSVDGKWKVYWSKGDKVRLNGFESAALGNQPVESTTADFDYGEASPTAPYKFLYPSSIYDDTDHGDGKDYIILPQVQTAKTTGFSDNMYPMVGYSTDSMDPTLQFLCSVVKVSVTQETAEEAAARDPEATPDTDNIWSVRFMGRNNEKVSGTFEVDYENATLSGVASNDLEKVVRFVHNQATNTETPVNYYVVIPAGTYENGFEIVITDKNGDMMRMRKKTSFTFEAGKLYPSDPVDFVPKESVNVADYEIGSPEDLIAFAKWYNSKNSEEIGSGLVVTLTSDIVFDDSTPGKTSSDFNETSGIGRRTEMGALEDYSFMGLFDGNGHTISGLSATVPLFVMTGASAVIRDLTLADDCSFTFTHPGGAQQYFGSVVGWHKGLLKNITVNSDVSLATASITNATAFGGIAGRAVEGVIDGCTYSGNISVPSDFVSSTTVHVGGICGNISNAAGVIKNSYFKGTIDFAGGVNNTTSDTPSLIVGGIAGTNSGTVDHCEVKEHATGISKTVEDDVDVDNSESGVNVTICVEPLAGSYCLGIGGVVGNNNAAASADGKIVSCKNSASSLVMIPRPANKTTANINYGGIAGLNTGAISSSDNYGKLFDSSDFYTQNIGGIVGANSYSVATCHNKSGANIYVFGYDGGGSGSYIMNLGGVIGMNASTGSVSTISNAADLKLYRIANNADTRLSFGGVIGVTEAGIDGGSTQEITNSGMVYEYDRNSKNTTLGFFHGGVIGQAKASVKNVKNTGQVSHEYTRDFAITLMLGGVIGQIESDSDVEVDNCDNEGEVLYTNSAANTSSTGNSLGGVIGYTASNVAISNCENSGYVHTSSNVTDTGMGYFLGGIIGYLAGGSSIDTCEGNGKLYNNTTNSTYTPATSAFCSGGIVGFVHGTEGQVITISNCTVSNKDLSARRGWLGGIAGYAEYADFSNCTMEQSIDNKNDGSKVYCKYLGGLAGWLSNCSVTSCTFSGSTLNATTMVANAGGGIVAQMDGGSLTDCYSYVTDIQKSDSPIAGGALIGTATGAPTVKNCHYQSTINGSSSLIVASGIITDGGGNDNILPAL